MRAVARLSTTCSLWEGEMPSERPRGPVPTAHSHWGLSPSLISTCASAACNILSRPGQPSVSNEGNRICAPLLLCWQTSQFLGHVYAFRLLYLPWGNWRKDEVLSCCYQPCVPPGRSSSERNIWASFPNALYTCMKR